MTDLVVTVPRNLWSEWIEEGDAVGEPETGEEWGFFLGHHRPPILPGERLYIVAHDRLRGYAPVTRVAFFIDNCPDHTVSEAMMAQDVGGTGYDCAWCREVLDACTFFGSDARPRIDGQNASGRWAIGRKGGAVAVTIPEQVRGFRGFRPRWWYREQERPFPGWIETDLWLNRARDKAKREAAKARAAAVPTSPDPQGELF